MFLKTFICFLFTGILLIPLSSATAGGHSGQFGIGLSVTEESPAFLVHYWLMERLTINPQFAFARTVLRNEANATRYIPGIEFLYHFRPGDNIRPFAGIGFALDMLYTQDNKYVDGFMAALFGGEYFFSDNFSVQGEYQLKVFVTDNEFSPNWLSTNAKYINTAQVLSVNLYF